MRAPHPEVKVEVVVPEIPQEFLGISLHRLTTLNSMLEGYSRDWCTYGCFGPVLKGEQNRTLEKTPKERYYSMGDNK